VKRAARWQTARATFLGSLLADIHAASFARRSGMLEISKVGAMSLRVGAAASNSVINLN
jgi:hypothetical protein